MSHDRVAQAGFNGRVPDALPDTQVVPRAQRRRFTASYKRRILQEADGCVQPGQIGALLRREGLYFSNLSTWRRQSARGELNGLSSKKRGPETDETARLIEKLKRENEHLRKKLEKAETIIEVQKKLSKLLGLADHLPKNASR